VPLARALHPSAAVLSALTVLRSPATAHAAQPDDTAALPERDALAALPVRKGGPHQLQPGQVMALDRLRPRRLLHSRQGPDRGGRHRPDGWGELRAQRWQLVLAYDDAYFTVARSLAIDHLVPLAEGRDSVWAAEQRQDYAIDLGDSPALIAASVASNRR